MSSTVIINEAEIAPSRPRREKLVRWGMVLGKFVSVQIVVQALGLAAGILLVRTLSQREYAFFTIANTMQATLLLLADVGVGSALSAVGGKVWQDKGRFSQLVQTGLHVRKKLAWASVIVSVPVLCVLLVRGGASIFYALVLTAAVLVGAGFRLTGDVLTIVPLLHGRVDQLQKKDLYAAGLRLLLLGAACLVFVNAAVAVAVASAAFGVQYVLSRRWASEVVDLYAPVNVEDKHMIIHVVKQQALTTIGYCVHGQLMIFLISYFGNTQSIAEVGALGRLTAILSVIGSVMSNILLPRFARCQDVNKLKKIWLQIIFCFFLLSAFLMSAASIAPEPMLWLLGKHYSHLESDLKYMVLGTVLSTMTGTLFALNASRAWTSWSWLQVPVGIVTQVALFPFLDLSTIKGVVLISSLPCIPGAIIYVFRANRGFQELTSFRHPVKASA